MTKFLFGVTALLCLAAGLLLLTAFGATISAPQQAAVAATSVALAVIPYVLARCFQLYELRDDLISQATGLRDEVRDLRSELERQRSAATK